METTFQGANTDRKAASRFGRSQPCYIAQQDDFAVIGVESRNGVGKDAFDLLSRDLILQEIAGICERWKHVGEIFFASMLPY